GLVPGATAWSSPSVAAGHLPPGRTGGARACTAGGGSRPGVARTRHGGGARAVHGGGGGAVSGDPLHGTRGTSQPGAPVARAHGRQPTIPGHHGGAPGAPGLGRHSCPPGDGSGGARGPGSRGPGQPASAHRAAVGTVQSCGTAGTGDGRGGRGGVDGGSSGGGPQRRDARGRGTVCGPGTAWAVRAPQWDRGVGRPDSNGAVSVSPCPIPASTL